MGAKAKGEILEPVEHAPPTDADRRRAPRVLVDLEVDYASEDNYLFAYITDISATGIFIRTTTPEAPGTHLNLRFSPTGQGRGNDHSIDLHTPSARSTSVRHADLRTPSGSAARSVEFAIEVEGEVIWVNPYRPGAPDNLHPGMGVRFVGIDDEVRAALLELIRRFAYLS